MQVITAPDIVQEPSANDFSHIGKIGELFGNLVAKYPELRILDKQNAFDENMNAQVEQGANDLIKGLVMDDDAMKNFEKNTGMSREEAIKSLTSIQTARRPKEDPAKYKMRLSEALANVHNAIPDDTKHHVEALNLGIAPAEAKELVAKKRNKDKEATVYTKLKGGEFKTFDDVKAYANEIGLPINSDSVVESLDDVKEKMYTSASNDVNQALSEFNAGTLQMKMPDGSVRTVGRKGNNNWVTDLEAALKNRFPDEMHRGIIDSYIASYKFDKGLLADEAKLKFQAEENAKDRALQRGLAGQRGSGASISQQGESIDQFYAKVMDAAKNMDSQITKYEADGNKAAATYYRNLANKMRSIASKAKLDGNVIGANQEFEQLVNDEPYAPLINMTGTVKKYGGKKVQDIKNDVSTTMPGIYWSGATAYLNGKEIGFIEGLGSPAPNSFKLSETGEAIQFLISSKMAVTDNTIASAINVIRKRNGK